MTRFVKPLRFFMVLGLFLFVTGYGFARLEEVANYKYCSFSEQNLKGFLTMIKGEQSELEKTLEAKYPDAPGKVTKDMKLATYKTIFQGADKLLERSKEEDTEEDLLDQDFMMLQRLHYGLLAELAEKERKSKIQSVMRMLKGYGLGPFILNVPKVDDPNAKLGPDLAKLEAHWLYKPGKKEAVRQEEIAQMSAFEVSRLQPPSNHDACTTARPGNHYDNFLKESARLIRLQNKDLEKFDFSFARRVLFVNEFSDKATTPKIIAKDRYGLKWCVKWGEEVHTDTVLTRIYIDLGATYTDIKFYSGPGESILVLDPPSETKTGALKNFSEFANALLTSKFKFNAARYLLPNPQVKDKAGSVMGSGIVDEAMAERESIPQKYVGAYYILFKECQLSLYNPAVHRLAGASLSNVGALEDRVWRSSMVFNCWVKNMDMKDGNSCTGLLYNSQTNDFDRMVEFQSDIGCSLGNCGLKGELNSFSDSFVMKMPQTINFIMRPLYVPRSWDTCTWADARWMALRIAALSRDDLERSFSESGWPPFVQKVGVEKLISRRNELVKAFQLEADGVKEMLCDPKFSQAKGADYPVKNGKINGRSALVKELEEGVHPEGLAIGNLFQRLLHK